ncbi:MAG: LamG-like jellyroll fold domain-containing protein [Betaproteobacteria bacterium]
MPNVIIDYKFDKPSVANADGSFTTAFTNATVAPGPGTTEFGNLANALSMDIAGTGSATLAGLKPDSQQFCIQIVFQLKQPVASRQTLVESDLVPFTLFVQPGASPTDFVLCAQVTTSVQGADGPSSVFNLVLNTGRWYTATLAYDLNTATLFVDGQIVSVHAFPDGRLRSAAAGNLYFGSSKGGANHFSGELAAFRWHNGIPEPLESLLDEYRTHSEWFITYKYEGTGNKVALGKPVAARIFEPTSGNHTQPYERGAIMYHDSVGAAFVIDGAIYAAYQAMANRSQLGYLVSDAASTTRAGGRKSVFSQGAIYWSAATGAIPVCANIYLAYEEIGESTAAGFPLKAAQAITGGLEQEFQGARFYYRSGGPKAHSVRGGILEKFLATGGVQRWGYPLNEETHVMSGSNVIGELSEFENGSIYWSGRTGAYTVRGDIRIKYRDLRGPLGWLGFPTSDQVTIPGYAGASGMNTFEHGSILWYGTQASTIAAGPFKMYLGRINSKESEGFLMGQNDLYCYVKLQDGAHPVYDHRHPGSGDWGGNIKDVNLTIPATVTPNDPNKTVTFSVDVWDSDPGNDDHLGTYTKVLNAANAWGLRENTGVFNSGAFSKINSITCSVKPDVDPRSLTESEKFWGVHNQSTPTISYQQYASAFRDVDSDTEWWDVTDWLDKAFYELVVDSLAGGGNCFGMSLEAINARKGTSEFGLPINRFTDWETVRNEFNIKHCYQVGAGPIWWFLDQFVSGNTHDPKDVFTRTRSEFERGNHPVLCISQNYNFSGAPHCILPVAWDASSKPWRITICDPNYPYVPNTNNPNSSNLRQLTVDPDANSFQYVGGNTYGGSDWSGGRLHYMPYSLLSGRQRTPVWDAILLVLAGTIIILSDDAETATITDPQGNDLDGFGSRATSLLQSGRHLDEFFVSFKGINARPIETGPLHPRPDVVLPRRRFPLPDRTPSHGPVAGEVLLRANKAALGNVGLPHLPLGDLLTDRRLRALSQALDAQPQVRETLAKRTVEHVVNDPQVMGALPQPVAQQLQSIANAGALNGFVHTVRGVRDGQLHYVVKHRLGEIKVGSTLKAGETHNLQVSALGSSKNTVRVESAADKLFSIEVSNKLSAGKDYLRINIENIPVGPGRELNLNLKPGLGGFDVVGSPQAANAVVTVEGMVGAKRIRSQFDVPMAGGIRIKPASILSENVLTFSRIDRIFGRPLSTGRIVPRP